MPAITNVHIDTFLTGIASGFKNDSYIADKVLPIVTAAKESGKIAGYGTDHFRVSDINARAIGGDAPRGDWTAITPISFSADDWEFEKAVDDRERALYDDPFDAERDATLYVTEKILLKREDVVATLLTTGGNFGGTAAAAVAWGTSATATPVKDIRTAMESVRSRTGVSGSQMIGVVGAALFNKMIQTSEFKTLFLNTVQGAAAPANLSPQIVANAIGLSAIYVGNAVKLTSKEGATDVFTDVWGTTTFAVIAKSSMPSLQNPGYGILISPTVPGYKGAVIAIDKYREEKKHSDIIRAQALFDCVAVTKALGQQITGA